MPVLENCGYKAPFWLPGGNAQTIGPRIVCFVPRLPFAREQLELEDGDFILVDWLFASGKAESPASKLVILSHGLEGDSTRSYMRAMAIAMANHGWDVASRNFRGCGGPINRLPVLYHSGETADLDAVVRHAEARGYEHIALVGFSMGANQILMYLGKTPEAVPASVKRAAAVSVPCDLTGCSVELSRPRNRIYMEYFLRTLRGKMREKHAAFPDLFDIEGLDGMKTFKEFDGRFTAPLGGFSSAEDYWEKASSLPYLDRIRIPSLVVNAANDPFLSESCYPVEEAGASPYLYLLTPAQGGHVGFPAVTGKRVGWLENTVADFLGTADH
ncbi:Alpha/beta hydrolase fold family protein [uncultured delta proteobacterium]|uniref:Alpha/beta hydrolase fold family protein n=1 Tax=uncultured delta proteobacterium TaxID=34034 RepID=A0A212J612_9DELT|nr:Alpha/beta hydrolase fold family protein [uncultured delta proteobacterium]